MKTNLQPTLDLFVTLAKALLQVGLPSHRVEKILMTTAEQRQIELQVLCLPTGFMMTFLEDHRPITYAIRQRSGGVNLARMTQLVRLADRLEQGVIACEDAKIEIDKIMQTQGSWGRLATVGAYVLSAAAFAVFFGGGKTEVLVSVCVGLAAGLLAITIRQARYAPRLFELLAAASAAAIAGAADSLVGSFVDWIPLAAGLIILLPGISLVDALEELSNGHLVSGGARIAGVGVTFLALTFGTVIGQALVALLPSLPQKHLSEPLPSWSLWPALAVVAIGSAIRFRARPRDLLVIFGASVVALLSARWGTATIGALAGPFAAAMVLGLVGAIYARYAHSTPELVIIPGIALLVPGSMGFRSLSSLLSENTAVGVDAAFHMFLVAMALVAGLLFSQAILPDQS
jgi:uncharacterized membrane protein YjjP (DUF1212 family)